MASAREEQIYHYLAVENEFRCFVVYLIIRNLSAAFDIRCFNKVFPFVAHFPPRVCERKNAKLF